MGETEEIENGFRCAMKHADQFVLRAVETVISVLEDEHKPWRQAELLMETNSYAEIPVSHSPGPLAAISHQRSAPAPVKLPGTQAP